tara:strand:- start:221 stop:478 length:258 start_codon:yes stop_codon:yes gene_type:complete
MNKKDMINRIRAATPEWASILGERTMNLNDLIKPGTITVMQHCHDDGCPTIKSQSINECTCSELALRAVPLETDEDIAAYLKSNT